jgi:excisionase family DNA binding protein
MNQSFSAIRKKMEAQMSDKLHTVPEISEMLDISRQTAYNWLRAGRFPNHITVGDGDMVLIPASDVETVRKEEAAKLIQKLDRLGFQAVPA